MKKETRGRKTILSAALTRRICALLQKGASIKSACIQSNIGERTYFDWQERGQKGEQPYAAFFSAATRGRERHKQRLIETVMEAAHKDARHAEWFLERQFPREFAPYDRRPIPREPEPVPDLSRSIFIGLNGLPDFDFGEYMRIEATYKAMRKELEAAGKLPKEFPITDTKPQVSEDEPPMARFNRLTKQIEPIIDDDNSEHEG